MEARGDLVANMERANCKGVWLDVAKLTDEKETLPDVTSGTLEMVFVLAEHVIVDWMSVTTSATSAGRAVLPTTKQAVAREVRGAERCQLSVPMVLEGEDLPANAAPAPARMRRQVAGYMFGIWWKVSIIERKE